MYGAITNTLTIIYFLYVGVVSPWPFQSKSVLFILFISQGHGDEFVKADYELPYTWLIFKQNTSIVFCSCWNSASFPKFKMSLWRIQSWVLLPMFTFWVLFCDVCASTELCLGEKSLIGFYCGSHSNKQIDVPAKYKHTNICLARNISMLITKQSGKISGDSRLVLESPVQWCAKCGVHPLGGCGEGGATMTKEAVII